MTTQSAAVAIAFVLLVGTVTTASIIRYAVDDALKIWAALGPIVGVLTGVVATYFFTKGTVTEAKDEAKQAHENAKNEAKAAKDALKALVKVVGHLDAQMWQQLQQDPTIERVISDMDPPIV